MNQPNFREGSVLAVLQAVADPRRREGRVYPLPSVIGMLLLAAVNGESSLLGMVEWGDKHWRQIWRPLGFKSGRKAPSYGAVWTLLSQLAASALGSALRAWSLPRTEEQSDALDIDGKHLRGSKRRCSSRKAVKVVSAAAQGLGLALEQVEVGAGGEIAAALQLLQGLPLQGKVVTLDAGIMCPAVTDTVLDHGGACLGLVKGNHGEVTTALEYWLTEELADAPPQQVETNKAHGRIEQREYWWTPSGPLQDYVAQEYGWHGIQLCGRVRRKRRPLYVDDWTEVKEHIVVYCSHAPELPTYEQCAQWLRQHWEIENRMFWVLDVTYGEDRNHARKTGLPLHQIRSWAISVLREQAFRFIPSGQRSAAARPDRGLAWLC
jgi:predicted transposase YbfD/YdcC